MRPVRLLLDGFGSYREAVDADFSDVDFFALVGPTGSGKSTVIDGLCFALYGTVPRWGRENVIAQALAPAANSCRVCLIFEASGKRYGVVRALTRDKRGIVHTKEARLERLDPSVPPDAPLADLLGASVEAIAEGPDKVKAQIQEILGLTYEHFTQSVLLPQGRFSEFLHAKAADRQDLLVELLAFGVYNAVGQRARKRAELAADRIRIAQAARDDLADVNEAAEDRAAERVRRLSELAVTVDEQLRVLSKRQEEAEQAARLAEANRAEITLLAGVRAPDDVPGLARRIAEAERLLIDRLVQRDAAERAEAQAQAAREALPDKAGLERLRDAYAEQREQTSLQTRQLAALETRRTEQASQAAALEQAEVAATAARGAVTDAERSHAAAALAEHLHEGEPCPVCLRPVTALPRHAAAADVQQARAAGAAADRALKEVRAGHEQAAKAVAVASRDVEQTTHQLEQIAVRLSGAAAEPDILAGVAAVLAAETELGQAQTSARGARQAVAAAEKQRAGLGDEERRAWAMLNAGRDSVVQLGAPATEERDLAAAWEQLTGWARQQGRDRGGRQPELDNAADRLRAGVASAQAAVSSLLAEHDIPDVADITRAEAAIARHRERAENELAGIRVSLKKAAELDQQIAGLKEEEQVAAMLGRLLRASSFERWLCGEALDVLVAEASRTLMELSGGQYQLDRDERNELVVIDFQDAGARRPVHTLSGGETFQASLALALALSRQVIGLSAGMRDLNSMFLDEGFGTLDEDTLETVASTLERLAADSDRMVGIITHVPALAERVPVRFVVSRAGTTSTLRKERV